MQMGMSSLLPSCDGTSKFSVNSIAFAFAFAPIGPWIDPLGAFVFVFTFGHMEASQYAYMHFQILLHLHSTCRVYGILA